MKKRRLINEDAQSKHITFRKGRGERACVGVEDDETRIMWLVICLLNLAVWRCADFSSRKATEKQVFDVHQR